MSVSIAPSPFGSLSVSVAETGSTLDVSVLSTSNCVLTMELGVPGPAGAQGPAGEGVPAGGTAGQVLAKVDGVDYNTEWVNVSGDYLPLAGGAMDSGAVVTYSNGSSDSEIGGWGFGVEQTGNTATYSTVEPGAISVYSDASNFATYNSYGVQVYSGSDYLQFDTSYWFKINDGDNLSTITPGKVELDNDGLIFTIDGNGITFPDATIQNTAAIQDAPADDVIYGRQNNGWVPATATVAWGDITGTLSNQTDLNTALGLKAPLASPAFTGNPTAPTAAFGDSDTSIATTAFVQAALAGGTAVAKNLEVYVRNQSGASIPAGSIVYISGATGNRPLITLSQANNDTNSAQTMGFTKTAIANNAFGYVIVRGEVENLDTSALTEGTQLYLSPTVAGAYTTTKPSAPQHLVYVGIVIRAHPTLGTILVAVQNGYELGEIHDVALGTLANNDLLAYESSTDLWKNKTFSALGLLTSATAASTYQTQAGMSSYLTTSTAASTYQTQSGMSSYATLSSPSFSGTPSLPTGTTGVTQTAGDNSTKLATTAFVTTAVPAFATAAETRAASSTTKATHPRDLAWARQSPSFRSLTPSVGQFTSTTNSTGGGQLGIFYRQSYVNALGYHSYSTKIANSNNNVGMYVGTGTSATSSTLNYSSTIWLSARWYLDMATTNNTVRMKYGHGYGSGVAGDLSTRGFGLKVTNRGGALILCHHNGTNYVETTSSFTPAQYQVFDWDIISEGGTVTLYVNGNSVASSSTNVPSGTASGEFGWQTENFTQTSNSYVTSFNEYGGHIFVSV